MDSINKEKACLAHTVIGWINLEANLFWDEWILAALLCFMLSFQPGLAGETVQKHILKNGLEILVLEKHSLPVVSVQVWYRAGSVDERDGIRGIAHLFEHMMFRGSEKYGPEEHARRIHDVGGSCNAFTMEHATVYLQSLPSQEIELAFELEADRMRGLRLNEDVLNTEREVVLEEFHRYLNNPFARAFLEFRKKLFSRHPYHWTPLGDPDDLRRITVEDCLGFYNSHYGPNNATLVVTGDVTREKVIALAERHLGQLARIQVRRPSYESEPEQEETRYFKLKLPIDVPVVAVTFRIPPASHADMPALMVLDQVLSSGRSSRLEDAIVKKKRVAVYTAGYLLVNKDGGIYACNAAYLPSRRQKTVVDAINEEIRRVQEDGITSEELEAARNCLLADKVFARFSVDALANQLGWAEFIEGDFHRFETLTERIDAVSTADVQRVAREYLAPNRTNVLLVRPERFRLRYWLAGIFYALRY